METPSNPKTEDYTYKQGQYSSRKKKDTTPKVNPQLAVELVFQELKRVEAYTRRIEDATAKKVEIDRGSLESAIVEIRLNGASEHPGTFQQRRRLFHHTLCFQPDDFSLVALCRHSVDFRTRLSVRLLHIISDNGGQQRLSVFLADDENGALISPDSLVVHEAENSSEHSLFPQLQLDELAAELALGMPAEVLRKLEDMVAALRRVVPFSRFPNISGEFFVGGADLPTHGNFAALNLLPVLQNRIVAFRISLQARTSFQSLGQARTSAKRDYFSAAPVHGKKMPASPAAFPAALRRNSAGMFFAEVSRLFRGSFTE